MRQLYKLVTILFAIIMTLNVNGQKDMRKILEATNTVALKRLSEESTIDFYRKKAEAKAFAEAHNLPLIIDTDGYYAELMYIDEAGSPMYFATNNVVATQTTNTDELHSGGSLGLNLEGAGFIVGEWDGGAVLASHEQLAGRITQIDAPAGTSDHATHVAATLLGDGTGSGVNAGNAKGMAPQATLHAWDFNNPYAEIQTASGQGLIISNHSYGAVAGWQYNSTTGRWDWHGGTAQLTVNGEDPLFGSYNIDAFAYDFLANNAPYHLICFAASNDRNNVPTANSPCFNVANSSTFNYDATIHPGSDGPYDCIPSFQTAKNVLTVGAVGDLPTYTGPASVVMTSFSSWGATDDGRIKPDLVANGFELYSASSSGNDQYSNKSGTSMACPNTAGSLILLQEHYENVHGSGNLMQSATLKALAIHTASEAGPAPGPDYQFGWGLLDVKKAVQVIDQDATFDRTILEGTLANGETKTYHIHVSDTVFRATLAWNDPAGTATAAGVLDDPTIKLVNDLDLRVTVDYTNVTTMPYILDPANPGNAATSGDNIRDNVEQVNILPPAGLALTVTVTHKGTLANPQNFALIMSELNEYCGTITFVGPNAVGSWLDPSNWDLGVVPTLCNDVVIPTPFLPNISSEAFARSVNTKKGLDILSVGSLTISGASGTGFINEGNLFIRPGTSLMIDSVAGEGLSNLPGGNIFLQGNLQIGQSIGDIGVHGLTNFGFVNVDGSLSINGMPGAGILNLSIMYNNGTIDLGQTDIGWHCLLNQTGAEFDNRSSGIIRANNTLNSGVSNNAFFNNEGTIEIGQLGPIVRHGIESADTFLNSGGVIKIDQTGLNGIFNISKFNNYGTVEIGQSDTIGQYGIENADTFSHNGGVINIDQTASHGVYNRANLFNNNAVMLMGQTGGVGVDGIYNTGFWNNGAGADIQIDETGRYGLFTVGTVLNIGALNIGTNAGNINNKGVFINGGDFVSSGSIDIANTIIYGLELQGGSLQLATGSTTYIGQSGPISGTGLQCSLGTLINSGEIRIDQSSSTGILHLGGEFVNSHIIDVGQYAGGIEFNGMFSDGISFTNLPGASIRLKSNTTPLWVPNLAPETFDIQLGSVLETN